MAFEHCPLIGRSCPFAFYQDGLRCGIGKGESKVEEIKSCDGKSPKYRKNKTGRYAAAAEKSNKAARSAGVS